MPSMTHLAFITQSGELFSPLIPTIYNFYNSLLNKQSHCPHFTVSLSGTKQILANFSLCTSFIEHQVYYTLTYSRLQSLEVAKDVNRPLILAPVARPLMEENSLQFCDIIFFISTYKHCTFFRRLRSWLKEDLHHYIIQYFQRPRIIHFGNLLFFTVIFVILKQLIQRINQ